MPIDPRRAKELFNTALDIPEPADRVAFLDRECGGDRELRERLEQLMAAYDQPASALERPLAVDVEGIPIGTSDETAAGSEPPASDGGQTQSYAQEIPAPASLIGSIIAGRYKLRQEIGEGGMGSVYLAEQTQPVKRQVALKLIKPGMDSRAVLARFESERQALALMDHPHIAKVFDAGSTEGGRPFFVMELVKGIPLTEYCDQHRLGVPERLALFREICSAVQHAHQKGIIHRDLKPTNILVESHDSEPVPKVIDFGLAKATSGMQLAEHSLFTAFGSVAGTPLYMAPEQAAFNALDVDTRADIYALGVILYELLTGSTPIRRETFQKSALDEMLRVIREVEPPTPSNRISTSDTLPSIAATRQTEPARLSRFVRGDLDWIVMKALAKERNRRYESAIALAQDIERFTNHEPVTAGPPTAVYRLRKFARRHRAALATAAGFALLLVAATTLSAVLAVRANRERVRAVTAEIRAKDQQGRARDREAMAIDAVRRYSDVVRETLELKNDPALARLRATLLKEPQGFFKLLRDKLQSDRDTTPDSLARVATASFDLGKLTDEIGDKQEALRAFDDALLINERLARQNPTVTQFGRALADSHHYIGIMHTQMGRPAKALESLEEARAIYERLARENPSVTWFQRELAGSYLNIGLLYDKMGRPAEALESDKRSRALWERLARENPSVTEFRGGLATSLNNIGFQQTQAGRPAEALESHDQARQIRERLTLENPSVAQFQSDLAFTYQNLAEAQAVTGGPAQALAAYEQALAIRQRLARAEPSVTAFQKDLALTHNNVGNLQSAAGRTADALKSYEQALAIQQRLVRDNPSVVDFQNTLAGIHYSIGRRQRETGRPAKAFESLEEARAIYKRLARENPSDTKYQGELAATHNSIGEAQRDNGRTAEALASFDQGGAIYERLARQNPSVSEFQRYLAGGRNIIGSLHLEAGRPAEALASFEQASAIQERLAREHPESPDFASELAGTLHNMAVLALGQRQFDQARARIKQAIEWQRKALAAKPNDPGYRQLLANHLANLILDAEGLNRADEANEARRERADLAAGDSANAALDARLAVVLEGKETPKDDGERIQLAHRAYEKAQYAASARLFAEALRNDSKLADDRQAQHPYNAACAAALAGSGQGKDDPPPDASAAAKLRSQASDWLNAELAAWAKVMGAGTAEVMTVVAQTLRHWKIDSALAGIRDEQELARLPEHERAAFKQLWNDVDRVLTQAAGSK